MSSTLLEVTTVPQPQPTQFHQTLEHIHKTRPRFEVDKWTANDAATWWYPQYDPNASNRLPPHLITALVMRVFMSYYEGVPFLTPLIRSLYKNAGMLCRNKERASVIAWTGFAEILHWAYKPDLITIDNLGGIGYDDLSSDYAHGYCGRTTCKHRGSWISGCFGETRYDRLAYANTFVPFHMVQWGGLGCLFTPLRDSITFPYISVRRERSHVQKQVLPYYVANALTTMHRSVPMLMQDLGFFKHVRTCLPSYVSALSTERLRFYGVVSMGSQAAKCMSLWDEHFTRSAWMAGRRDKTYSELDCDDFLVDDSVMDNLAATEPDDLFPSFPVSVNKNNSPDVNY
jgi:hypothetical protein